MFKKNEIWSYPTDTSFGLGVRVDDKNGLKKLAKLKKRSSQKLFSIMVKDWEMLKEFAQIPANLNEEFFTEKQRTVILKPTKKLPKSSFWLLGKVAFRICTIREISEKIIFPITATSANLNKENPVFEVEKLREIFGDKIKIYKEIKNLKKQNPSEIWDFTGKEITRIR